MKKREAAAAAAHSSRSFSAETETCCLLRSRQKVKKHFNSIKRVKNLNIELRSLLCDILMFQCFNYTLLIFPRMTLMKQHFILPQNLRSNKLNLLKVLLLQRLYSQVSRMSTNLIF